MDNETIWASRQQQASEARTCPDCRQCRRWNWEFQGGAPTTLGFTGGRLPASQFGERGGCPTLAMTIITVNLFCYNSETLIFSEAFWVHIGTISYFELVIKSLQSHLEVKVLLTKAGRTSWQGAQAWRERPHKRDWRGGQTRWRRCNCSKGFECRLFNSAARDLFRDEGSFRLVGRSLCHLWSS